MRHFGQPSVCGRNIAVANAGTAPLGSRAVEQGYIRAGTGA